MESNERVEKRRKYIREWQRKYRNENREKLRLEGRERWKKNRKNKEWVENYRKFQKEWMRKKRENNPLLKEKESSQYKKWYWKNREKKLLYAKKWREKNKERRLVYQKNYIKNKPKDSSFRISIILRSCIVQALKRQNHNKRGRLQELLGITVPEFKNYLEKKFVDGMSWDNQGKWHIDHIKPCSSFNLSSLEQQKKCFNYKNLQPLWAIDNLKKGSKCIKN